MCTRTWINKKCMKRVVITGLGIYSCLGKTLEDVRDSLYNGKSGIVFDPERPLKDQVPDLCRQVTEAIEEDE